jgi:hypothetical protein
MPSTETAAMPRPVPRAPRTVVLHTLGPLAVAVVVAGTALGLPDAAWSQGASVGAVTARGPGARLAAGEVEVRARVVELDAARRVVVLKTSRGEIVSVDVPPAIENFEQVRLGDQVVVRYSLAIASRIEPASRSGIRERIESSTGSSAPAGALPGSTSRRDVEVLATVDAIDPKNRVATLRGVHRSLRVRVPDDVDLGSIRVGDRVHVWATEGAVLAVQRVPAAR